MDERALKRFCLQGCPMGAHVFQKTPNMRMDRDRNSDQALLPMFAVLLILASPLCSKACTVFEFEPTSFANSLSQLYTVFPFFNGTNGEFFVDNTDFLYSCTQIDGLNIGWHEFFQVSMAPFVILLPNLAYHQIFREVTIGCR
jgi:hypothetical protein